MKIWGMRAAWVIGVVAILPLDSFAERQSRRMDVEFRAPEKPAVPARVRETKFPVYLKSFNDTHTPGQLYHRLSPVTSPEWKSWYASTHRQVPLHRTSVEFLERDSFLVRTPGTMSLLNTTRMEEGVLLISRRPFPFTLQESLGAIAGRLGKVDVRNRYESQLPMFRIFEMLYRSTVSWASGTASESAVRIAPLVALIDIERSRARCLDVLEDVPNRGPASLITTDCRRALAEQRGLPDPSPIAPSGRPSRRLIVETARGPSPITESGAEPTTSSTRAPASAFGSPAVIEGAGRD